MVASTAALALLASTAAASSVGSAIIVNKCSYDAYLDVVPAEGGGYTEFGKVLKSGDQFAQEWTELSNGNGWSLKLTPNKSLQPMQFEYTWQNEGTIWFDISNVDGDPYGGDWVINGDNSAKSCKPKHVSYWYPTDDHAMQDCPGDSTITVILCGADSPSSYPSAPSVKPSSAPVYTPPAYSTPSTISEESLPTSTEAPSTYQAPSSTTVESPPASTYHHWDQSSSAPVPTTFPTQTTELNGHVITVINTAYVTDYVTQTLWVRDAAPTAAPVKKRHQHHPHGHHV